MSKIVKNTTIGSIDIPDTGVTIPASPGQYTIPPQEYPLWGASDDIIVYIGSGDLVINDGSTDLAPSDGIDLIKGYHYRYIRGATDGTAIGNVSDKLKVYDPDVIDVLIDIAAGLGVSAGTSIFKYNEAAVSSRNEFDLSGTTYTVPVGKRFVITSFCASYDAQAALYVRVKKQTGGTGPWVTQFRLNMMSGGQGNSTIGFDLNSGIEIGAAGDVFKITVEGSIAKGTIYAEYSGSQV